MKVKKYFFNILPVAEHSQKLAWNDCRLHSNVSFVQKFCQLIGAFIVFKFVLSYVDWLNVRRTRNQCSNIICNYGSVCSSLFFIYMWNFCLYYHFKSNLVINFHTNWQLRWECKKELLLNFFILWCMCRFNFGQNGNRSYDRRRMWWGKYWLKYSVSSVELGFFD